MKRRLLNNLLKNNMKKIILLFVVISFLFGGCSITKKCDGNKKMKSQMW